MARIACSAFDLERVRAGRVCSADKTNMPAETSGVWRRTVQALRDTEYPDVALTHMDVENCAMQLVRNPTQFDVILTGDLFGDISLRLRRHGRLQSAIARTAA
jgi:3-isopropylmalate dehydrogenase